MSKTNDAPLVSILIINFNGGSLLKECLSSVLAQTYTRLEIVLCDDASVDDSVEIFRTAMLARPDLNSRVVQQNINNGAAANMYAGLLAFSGQYVLNVDSDDLLHPQHVELLVAVAESTGADVCSVSSVRFYDTAEVRVRRDELIPIQSVVRGSTAGFTSEVLPALFFKESKYPFEYWHRLYRRDFAARARSINRSSFRNSDSAFSLFQLCEARTYAWVDTATYFYRQRQDSVTNASRYLLYKERTIGSLDSLVEHYASIAPSLRSLNLGRNAFAGISLLDSGVDEGLGWRNFRADYLWYIGEYGLESLLAELRSRSSFRARLGSVAMRAGPSCYYLFRRLRSLRRRRNSKRQQSLFSPHSS